MDRKLLRNFDFILLWALVGLVAFGLVTIFSATKGLPIAQGDPLYFVKRQLRGVVLGFVALAFALRLDYRHLIRLSRLFYGATLLLLSVVLVAGKLSQGAVRWLSLGPLNIQPAELVKVGLILLLAGQLSHRDKLQHWRGLAAPLLYTLVPMALVLLQPDLGTALTLAGILMGMLFFAGTPTKYVVFLGAGGLAAGVGAVVASLQGWVPILKPYQINRLIVFLDPFRYRHDEGWNVIQSMIAIGSGSFFGKGLFGGSQTQLNFLPARHTDFIFSVIGEEFGFLGALALLLLFALVFWRGGAILLAAKDASGSLIVAGVLSLLFVHVVINVGMTLGVMPVTGLPLPLISYGGTSIMTTLLAFGLVFNVGLYRQKIRF